MSNHTATDPCETGAIRIRGFRASSASVVYHGAGSFGPASGLCHGVRMTNVTRDPIAVGLDMKISTAKDRPEGKAL